MSKPLADVIAWIFIYLFVCLQSNSSAVPRSFLYNISLIPSLLLVHIMALPLSFRRDEKEASRTRSGGTTGLGSMEVRKV